MLRAHRAVMKRHSCLSSAASVASFQVIGTLAKSLSIELFHVSFGLPRFLLPIGVQKHTFLGNLSLSILTTCPNHLNRLSCIILTISLAPVRSIITSFLTLSKREIPKILRRQFLWKALSFFASVEYSCQVSLPYNNTGIVVALYIFNLVFRLSCLDLIIFSIFPKAVLAFPIRVLMSSVAFPCLLIVLPRYQKVSVTFIFVPSISMSILLSGEHMASHFLLLNLKPIPSAVSFTSLVHCCKC